MRGAMVPACAVVLLLAQAADADILKTTDGGQMQGTLQEVTFLVKGAPSIYPRDEIESLTISADGKDVLDLQGEGKLTGKAAAIAFETTAGLRSVARDKTASVTLDSATTAAVLKAKEKDEADKAEEQKKQLSDEQKAALTKNRELYKTYSAKIDDKKKEERDAIKTKYMGDVKRVVSDIVRLERTIDEKMQRRRYASDRTTNYDGRNTESERDRLQRTDSLERDQQALDRARQDAVKLKRTIRAEQKKASDNQRARESRVESVASSNRKRIMEGEILSADDMTVRYEAAIKLPGEKDTKGKK